MAAPQRLRARARVRTDRALQLVRTAPRPRHARGAHATRAGEGLHHLRSSGARGGRLSRDVGVGARGQDQISRGHHRRTRARACGIHRPAAGQELRQAACPRRDLRNEGETKMKAAYYERKGPASEVLKVGEMPDPEPGPGDVRVRVKWSAVNPSDTKGRSAWDGNMQMLAPRIIPHQDGAGVIDKVGPGVPSSRVGERVWIY